MFDAKEEKASFKLETKASRTSAILVTDIYIYIYEVTNRKPYVNIIFEKI